jgi:thiamine pyrophosphokinase
MEQGNVQSLQGVTLVGAGQPESQEIAQAMQHAPRLVAADGGALFCLANGLTPSAVIGDFDSIDDATRNAIPDAQLIRIEEQETTDFEKCLTRIDAPFVIATGFTAGRVDHALAVWSVLARGIGPPTLVLGSHDVVLAAPRSLTLDLTEGTRVSLYPLAPVTGRTRGLYWPIDGLTLDPVGRIGTSNIATGRVDLEFDAPGCLVIMPREVLAVALAALTD